MDLGDVNLNGILQTLAANNKVHWWNTFRKRNGKVMLKIEFDNQIDSGENMDYMSDFNQHSVSFKRRSETQRRRNFNRAQEFRRNQDVSIELPRKIDHSTPGRIPDISNCVSEPCLSPKPSAHDESELHASYEEPYHDARDGSISATHEEPVNIPTQSKQFKEDHTTEKDQGKSESKPKSEVLTDVKPARKFKFKPLCKRQDCSFGSDPSNAHRHVDNSWNPELPSTICSQCPDFHMCANCFSMYSYKLHAHHIDFFQPYLPCTEDQLSN